MNDDEYFGTVSQQTATRKAYFLWQTLKDDKRFESHGRWVDLNCSENTDINLHVALCRLQGASAAIDIPVEQTQKHIDRLHKLGFKTDRYELWKTTPDALSKCQKILQDHKLAEDLEIVTVNQNTEPGMIQKLARLTESCEVLLPMGHFIRGYARPSSVLYVQDKSGTPVGFSAAIASAHSNSKNGNCAFWGMIATLEERRGERIALLVGASVMIKMHQDFGFDSFKTGIRKGNTPSERLCTKLGLCPSGTSAVIAIDPEHFSEDRITK